MKKFASRRAKNLRGWLLKDSHPDSGCGIKIVDREVFLRVPFFNHMHRFMSVLVRREGGVVIEVPVGHRAREQGNSKYGILDRLLVGISDIIGVMWLLSRTNHPEEIKEIFPKTSHNNATEKY
jgi:dolichol-phosphate mannosyltransferase